MKKLKGKLQRPTADLLQEVVEKNTADMICIKDIINNMNQGGFALIMLIFSLPILIPVPPPLPSLIAIPLFVMSAQMTLGFSAPIVPKFVGNKQIKRELLAKIIEKSVFRLRKSEKFIKPRMGFIFNILNEKIIGLSIFILALSISVPLPLTNLLPGIAILITSLGLLSKDGLIVMLGLTIGICGLLLTTSIIIFGTEIFIMLKDFILNGN